MELLRSGDKTRQLKSVVYVLCVLSSLHTYCSSDSSEDVIVPSNYYFSLPMLNFGAYFYVAFPNDTLKSLHETLCDIRIQQCTLSYSWFGDLNRDRFPYYYIITEAEQQRVAREAHLQSQPLEQIYSNNILCDTLTEAREANITCRRLRLDDDLCERVKCLNYSVQLNTTRCSFPCSMLLWNSDYDLKVLYFNFGEFPEPVKDGVCEAPGGAQTTTVATSTSTGTTAAGTTSDQHYTSLPTTDATSEKHNQNTSDTNSTDVKGNTDLRPGEVESSGDGGGESSSLSIPILVGSVGGGLFLLAISAMSVIVCFRRSRGRSNNKSEPSSGNGSVSSRTTDLSTSSSELSRSDTENSDSGNYHTLDEMGENLGHVSNSDECDAEGYNIIQDCQTKTHHSSCTVEDKRCRPLPQLPDNVPQRMRSMSPGGNSSGQSSTNVLTPSLPLSLDPAELGLPPPGYRQMLDNADSVVSPPRPHKRLVNLEKHTYLGLVNLRPDHTVFGHVTEVKLVRTQAGHLELVHDEGEQPTFSDYYTRLHLITETGGGVGVVGVLDTDVDSLDTTHLSCYNSREDSLTHVALEDSGTIRDKSPKSEDDPLGVPVYMIYFGPVSLSENFNVSPCDYLTAVDINPNTITCTRLASTGNDGYLTVRDVENINGSAGSHAYLQLV